MQSKEQVLKKTLGKKYIFIKSYFPLETEICTIKSIIDADTVSALFKDESIQKVSIFDLRNPEQDI